MTTPGIKTGKSILSSKEMNEVLRIAYFIVTDTDESGEIVLT